MWPDEGGRKLSLEEWKSKKRRRSEVEEEKRKGSRGREVAALKL
jgi:hypothetical protein